MNTKHPKYTFGLLETPSALTTAKPRADGSSSLSTSDFHSDSHTATTPAQWRTPKGGSYSSTPYTSSSTVSKTHSSSTIVAVVEGRCHAKGEIGLSSLDLKQPVLTLSQFSDSPTYSKTLSKMQLMDPIEIILPSTLCKTENNSKLFSLITKNFPNVQLSLVQRHYFNESKGLQYIRRLCAPEYKSIELQVSSKYYCLATTSALLKYIEFIQNVMFAPDSLKAVFKGWEHSTMIDSTTIKNLELLQNMKDATCQQTLFGILNFTKTISGCRFLRSNILQPPNDEETIRLRQDAIRELVEKEDVFSNLQFIIGKFTDIDHMTSVCVQIPKQETVRWAENKLTCVISLKHVLHLVKPLQENLSYCENHILKMYCKALDDSRYQTVLNKIDEVIDEGTQYHKGYLQQQSQKCMAVKSQINGLLDVARRTYSELVDDMENYIRQLAENHMLPLRTAYSSLRGFHIQMPLNIAGKSLRDDGTVAVQESLPSIFIKVTKFKNTLSFSTMDLLQLNERMKTALDEIYRMTNIVISDLLARIHGYIGCLYQLSEIVAMTDMLLAFTSAATVSNYVCPEFTDTLAIKQGLHPILQKISTDTVVANDTYASEHSNVVIITGPNMAGKSTYLKQIALLQIMAQIGSFVPAQYASFRIVDQIFSRIGSDDDIESNSSTFTLEMKESSYILQNVCDNSLVIIDELGRGTSTEEALGICWTFAEHLLMTKAFTFFVTHFKKLTELKKYYQNVANYYFEVKKTFNVEAKCEKIHHTHVLSRGVAPEKHYGLQLVELSMMPLSVVSDARQIVTRIETQEQNHENRCTQKEKQNALFNLAVRLIQAAKNSRMDENSLKVYLKSLYKSYTTEYCSASKPSKPLSSHFDK